MRSLLLKVTIGADAPERCLQGLTVAAVAAASGAQVSLWLAGEAVWLAAAPAVAAAAGVVDVALEGSPAGRELLAAVLATGSVRVCTQCVARRKIAERDLVEGVLIGGATEFVAEALDDGVQALVY
jgi:predicted peroxiredoxin